MLPTTSSINDEIRGLNSVEIDQIAFLVMDVLFASLNTLIGYKLLGKNFKSIQRSIKILLVCVYLGLWLQAAGSIMMVPLIFRFSDREDAQLFLGFVFGRWIDQLVLNISLLLFFKMMFSLKRAQIQIDERNKSVKAALIAL